MKQKHKRVLFIIVFLFIMSADFYRNAFNPNGSNRRRSGNTRGATHIVYDFNFSPDHPFSPYYYQLEGGVERQLDTDIGSKYDLASNGRGLRAVDELVTTVYRPFIDIDHIDQYLDYDVILDHARSIISRCMLNVFGLLKKDNKRRILIMTSNPRWCSTRFRYNGNRAGAEDYFNKPQPDGSVKGTGIHITFCDEKCLVEQHKYMLEYLREEVPGARESGNPFGNIDAMDSANSRDNLVKLRMPLCDNGRTGFPGLPYVPMAYLEYWYDDDEESLRYMEIENRLSPEDVVTFGRLRLPGVKPTDDERWRTSVYNEKLYEYMALRNRQVFNSLKRRLHISCAPFKKGLAGCISLSDSNSDLYIMQDEVNRILLSLASSAKNLQDKSADNPQNKVKREEIEDQIKRCANLFNEVVFMNAKSLKWNVITYNSDTNCRMVSEAPSGTNFCIDTKVPVFEVFTKTTQSSGGNGGYRRGGVDVEEDAGVTRIRTYDVKWDTFLNYIKTRNLHLVVSDIIFDPSAEVLPVGIKIQAALNEKRTVVNTYPGRKANLFELEQRYSDVCGNDERLDNLMIFRNFIRFVLVGGNIPRSCLDEESMVYLEAFERYFKQLVVLPHLKTTVCLSLRGPAGYGKSWFFEQFIKEVYGEDSSLIRISNDLKKIAGKFTDPRIGEILFVFVDEGKFNTDQSENDAYKQLTTQKRTLANKKFKDVSMESNYLNFATANNATAGYNIKCDSDDRRIMPFSCWTGSREDPYVKHFFRDDQMNIHPHVNHFIEWVLANGVFTDFLAFLAFKGTYPDVYGSRYNLQRAMPKTFTLQDTMTNSMDINNKMWKTYLFSRKIFFKLKDTTSVKMQKRLFKSKEERSAWINDAVANDLTVKGQYLRLTKEQKAALVKKYGENAEKAAKVQCAIEVSRDHFHSLQDGSTEFLTKISQFEKDGYRELHNKRNPKNPITGRVGVRDYAFYAEIYNAQNITWPREFKLDDYIEEMKASLPANTRIDRRSVIKSLCSVIGADEAEFTVQVETSGVVEIPPWNDCLKAFAFAHQFSNSYIENLCHKSKNHVDVIPWPSARKIRNNEEVRDYIPTLPVFDAAEYREAQKKLSLQQTTRTGSQNESPPPTQLRFDLPFDRSTSCGSLSSEPEDAGSTTQVPPNDEEEEDLEATQLPEPFDREKRRRDKEEESDDEDSDYERERKRKARREFSFEPYDVEEEAKEFSPEPEDKGIATDSPNDL